jgi:hypothetical protein
VVADPSGPGFDGSVDVAGHQVADASGFLSWDATRFALSGDRFTLTIQLVGRGYPSPVPVSADPNPFTPPTSGSLVITLTGSPPPVIPQMPVYYVDDGAIV